MIPAEPRTHPREPDPLDAALGLHAWLSKYCAADYRMKHEVTMRLNHMPPEHMRHAVKKYRRDARAAVAVAAWGRSIIAVHEKWWPMDFSWYRIAMPERKNQPFFTAQEAIHYPGAYFAELEMAAISIPMMPQMGYAGRASSE